MPSPGSASLSKDIALPGAESTISPQESVAYSKELIEDIQKIAAKQGHKILAQLLGLAAQEADAILKSER